MSDSAPDVVQRVLRRHGKTPVRKVLTRAAVGAFFADYELREPVLYAIAEKANRVHRLKRGDECFALDERRIFLLVSGCVQENQGSWAPPRIWAGGTLFGTWSGQSFHSSSGTVLSEEAHGLFLGVEDVRRLGGEFPELYLAFGGMTHQRLRLMEELYGASKASATYRVASLLLYLTTTKEQVRLDSDGTVTLPQKYYVEGPTQADIADALGLSRAAVENALAALRDYGAVRSTRRVRYYEIDRLSLMGARDRL
jgi:CRP-like cAMP-binding protein